MAFGFGGGLLDSAMPQGLRPGTAQRFQSQFQPQFQPQQQPGGFGGGIFDRLRQQFPQLFGNLGGAQQFGGQQPILNQQVPGQFTGQNQPVLNQQPQPPTAVQFGGQQPVLNQIPQQGPPGVQSVVPPQLFGDSFGAQPPGAQQFMGGQPILRQAQPQGIQPFGGPQQQQPILNQLPLGGREQLLQNKANLGFGGIA